MTILLVAAAVADDLRPLKPALAPNLWLPALIVALALLALVAVAARSRRRAGAAAESPGEPAPAPGPMMLRERLERIRDSGWLESGAHIKACDAMAEVLRDFARARWIVSSVRMTTSELLGELAARGADTGVTGPLGDVLGTCDLVKFAGARLRTEDIRGHLDTALVLVDVYGTEPAA